MTNEFKFNKVRLQLVEEDGRWLILATPSASRDVDAHILWDGPERPSVEQIRFIYNAIDYGIRLSTRAASIYVDSLIITPENQDKLKDL